MADQEKETHVQASQGGFEGRRRQGHQDGFEGRYKQVPPSVKEAKPGERPPEERPPAGEPGHIDLIKRILEQHDIFVEILAKLNEMLRGVAPRQEIRYYNTPQTAILVATPNPAAGQALDPENPGYQAETVFNQLQRIAPQISVINDGNATLYVITTPDSANWSPEAAILVGEARRFYNVYELRLRSTVAGTVSTLQGGIYRVTEYEYSLAYTSTVTFNRTAFIAQSVVLPDALNHALDAVLNAANVGATLPIAVPNGFALVVRSNVKNAGTLYVSASDATNAVLRVTLNAGDTLKLFITSSSLVFVALTNFATDRVDILVEQ